MPLETTPFDAAEYLGSPEAQAELLRDALETGDTGYIAHALGVIVRARGVTHVAREAEPGSALQGAVAGACRT